MIPIHRNSASTPQDVRIKVVGLGGAGNNVLDRILLDGMRDADLVAINTDARALTASVVEHKVQLGRGTTRGLGAGGDPEVGYTAAEESVEEIRQALEGAELVILCVGLGGGTGSGAARIVASLARDQKALVVVFATLPFLDEGKRRRLQADEALAALQRYADVVIHFENDRMSEAVSPLAVIQETFAAADQTLSQGVRAIARVARQRGLIHIGFDELATAMRGAGESGAQCVFGYGEAEGDNRAHDALARALKNPLMEKGKMLDNARNVLINVAGGPSMTLNEVQILMEEFNRSINDHTRLLFGVAVDPQLGQKITVTILSAVPGETPAVVELRPRATTRVETSPVSVAPTPTTSAPIAVQAIEPPIVLRPLEPEPEPVLAEPVAQVVSEPPPERAPAPTPEPARTPAPTPKLPKAKPVQAKQEQMQFEPVTRGRFEKSEPTIVDGQDLDVPTFLRRNVKVR